LRALELLCEGLLLDLEDPGVLDHDLESPSEECALVSVSIVGLFKDMREEDIERFRKELVQLRL
jgi:hypothetical protein